MAETPQHQAISDVLENLRDASSGDNDITTADLLEAVEGRAFGPILLLPGIIIVSPLGAIPFVPSVIGVFLFLVSLQLVLGKSHPWLPKSLRERGVDRQKALRRIDKFQPWVESIEKCIKPRLHSLTESPMPRIIGCLSCVLALLLIPLEVIPFAAMIPGLAITCFGVALSSKDGLVMILGLMAATAAGALAAVSLLG